MSRAAEIEAQAAVWIARCDAQASGPKNAEFIAWLAADPRHRAAYLRLAEAWRRSEHLERLRPPGGSPDPDLLTPSRKQRFWRRLPQRARDRSLGNGTRPPQEEPISAPADHWLNTLGIACAIALLIIIGSALWSKFSAPSVRIYRTSTAGLSRIVLSDGSKITLNSNSEVRVHFTADARSVTLTRGEAEFAVTHDVQRPFEVQANDHAVIAVGTQFDVRLDSDHAIEVAVTEGRVALVQPGFDGPKLLTLPPPIIRAGEIALATASHVTIREVPSGQISRRLAWEHHELSFQGESLNEAIAEFNRYNGRRLVIDDPSLGSLRIGGNFDALDVASFVAALGRSFEISAHTSRDGTIHLSRRPPPTQSSSAPP